MFFNYTVIACSVELGLVTEPEPSVFVSVYKMCQSLSSRHILYTSTKKVLELVDVPDCHRDSHSPQASIKQGQTSQLMKSEALQETGGFQTTFGFLIKTSNCNRSCNSHIYTWLLLKRGWAEFLLPQAAKIGFPLPYLLAAHRFGAGCATVALHDNVWDQLTGDFHNTSAESSWL